MTADVRKMNAELLVFEYTIRAVNMLYDRVLMKDRPAGGAKNAIRELRSVT